MIREIAERQRNILVTNAQRDREVAIHDAEKIRNDYEDQARNAYANGITAEGDRLMRLAQDRDMLIAQNHGGSYDPKVREIEDRSIMASAAVMKQVRDRIGNNTIFDSDLVGLIRVLSGYDPNGQVAGVDAKWINDNLPSQRQRQALINQLQQVHSNWTSTFNAQKTEAVFNDFMKPYLDGYRGHSPGKSPAITESMVEEWGRRNNVNLYTPDGVQKTIQQFGFMPSELVKNFFSGVSALGSQDVQRRFEVYNQLKNSQTVGNTGGPVAVGLQSMSDADRAFMEHYSMAIGGSTPEAAATIARTAIKNHVPVVEGERGKKLLAEMKLGNDTLKETDMYSAFDSYLKGAKYIDLPADARHSLLYNAENMLAYGLKPDRAIKSAAEKFTLQFSNDPSAIVPWVKSQNASPMSLDTKGQPSRDYIAPLIKQIIDPNNRAAQIAANMPVIDPANGAAVTLSEPVPEGPPNRFTLPGGTKIPEDARYNADGSGNVKLVPQSNGTFALAYIDSHNQQHPIVDKNFIAVQIDLKKAAASQTQHIQDVINENNSNRVRTKQENDKISDVSGSEELSAAAASQQPPAPLPVAAAQPKLTPVELRNINIDDVLIKSQNTQGEPPARFEKKNVKASATTAPAGASTDEGRLPDVVVNNVSLEAGNRPPTSPTPYAETSGSGAASKDGALPKTQIQGQVVFNSLKPEIKEFATTLLKDHPALVMTSGFRGEQHNHEVGGVKNSQHLSGNAMDFSLRGMTLEQKGDFLDQVLAHPKTGGVGYYPNSDSIHVDFRDNPVAWGGNKSSSSLPQTPFWFRDRVNRWLNG
jgi:hypothetical protein